MLGVAVRNLWCLNRLLLLHLSRKFLLFTIRSEVLFVLLKNWALRLKSWIVVVGISHWVYNLRLITILRNNIPIAWWFIHRVLALLHPIVRRVLCELIHWLLHPLLTELSWNWFVHLTKGTCLWHNRLRHTWTSTWLLHLLEIWALTMKNLLLGHTLGFHLFDALLGYVLYSHW
jgi:hypothetical protein